MNLQARVYPYYERNVTGRAVTKYCMLVGPPTKGLRSKPQGTQLWRLRWHSLCAMRGNMKLETPAVFCAT